MALIFLLMAILLVGYVIWKKPASNVALSLMLVAAACLVLFFSVLRT